MGYVPHSRQLRGLSVDCASLYGMPHINARYERDDTDSNRLMAGAWCACCGKPANNSHHEPPRSKGRCFLLVTDWGRFVLKPALIALCGSGTIGCHGARHNGRLRIRWEWDSDENAEKWWSGYWLAHGYMPNSRRLFELGRYAFSMGGREWEVRL